MFNKLLTNKLIDSALGGILKTVPVVKWFPPAQWLIKFIAKRGVNWLMAQSATKAALAHVQIEATKQGKEYKKQLEEGNEEKIKQSFDDLVSFNSDK